MDYETSETGNWNVAQNWTNEMIFRPFLESIEYLQLAKFGYSDIEEYFTLSPEIKIQTRIQSIDLARNKIEMGIRLCLFAIRSKQDKDKVKELLDDAVKLQEYIPMIKKNVTDRDKIKLDIDEENFNHVYKVLLRIITEVTEPMNRNDLIFNFREQFDPAEFKRGMKERYVQGG
jgi:hypothetical protein